jgi:hypothetical protein
MNSHIPNPQNTDLSEITMVRQYSAATAPGPYACEGLPPILFEGLIISEGFGIFGFLFGLTMESRTNRDLTEI